MAKSRVSKKVVNDVTMVQFNTAMADYAADHAKAERLTAKMNEEITRVREKYADDLENLAKTCAGNIEVIETWCKENPLQFASKKSMETVHGTVGFRTAPPAIRPLKGFTWSSALILAKKELPDYVRTKEELNKEMLLADREKPNVKLALPGVGLMVDQDETFFIDLKKEEHETGKTTKAA